MSVHKGHRERIKRRYLVGGPACMHEHEILELMLTYAIPRKDVNELAHELIDKFGSLRGVLSSEAYELAEIRGISMHTAVLLKLFGDAAANALFPDNALNSRRIVNVADAMEICCELIPAAECEAFCAVMLDGAGYVLDRYVDRGDRHCVRFDRRRFVARALASGAVSAIICHSHPFGSAACSADDERITNDAAELLSGIGVRLAEHVIVTKDDCRALLHDVRMSDIEALREAEKPLRLLG